MTYHPISPPESRTLLTFPTEGLPSPRITPVDNLRPFPVRYPDGALPAQTQVNRWLCCRCAEEGYPDPVGMVHYEHRAHSQYQFQQQQQQHREDGNTGAMRDERGGGGYGPSHGVCWREACRHRKCLNCALYAGPLSRDHGIKLLIRTVGGLHASPRFVDPVYWECVCGEWARNRFDSRCTLGSTGCRNPGCAFLWGVGGGGGAGCGPGGHGAGGAGLLTAETVVMNRYGQRLGTADQRAVVADGPWNWQRRALGDARCAVVAGLRAAMKRTGDGLQFASGNHRSTMCDLGRLWKEGGLVPHYPYRRPPPVDESDVGENNEYEGSYLAGMPTEPLDKGKGVEQQHNAPGRSPGFRSAPSPVTVTSVPVSFFPGWNHLQM